MPKGAHQSTPLTAGQSAWKYSVKYALKSALVSVLNAKCCGSPGRGRRQRRACELGKG